MCVAGNASLLSRTGTLFQGPESTWPCPVIRHESVAGGGEKSVGANAAGESGNELGETSESGSEFRRGRRDGRGMTTFG